MLAVAGEGSASVKLWDTNTWKLAATLSIPRPEGPKPTDKTARKKFVLSVAWSVDGKRLACGSMDGTISVFDVAHSKFQHHLEGHFMPVRSLVYSPVEPHLLFSASDDAHVHMYDAEGKPLIGAMSGHSSWVLSVDASPDGAAVATGSSDRTVRLWGLNMRTAVHTMTNHTDQVWSVAFRPPGGAGVQAGRLASVSDDKSIGSTITREADKYRSQRQLSSVLVSNWCHCFIFGCCSSYYLFYFINLFGFLLITTWLDSVTVFCCELVNFHLLLRFGTKGRTPNFIPGERRATKFKIQTDDRN